MEKKEKRDEARKVKVGVASPVWEALGISNEEEERDKRKRAGE